jgi:hypothetical protein
MVEIYQIGMSVPIPRNKDDFRWYLCMESGPLKWKCTRTTADEALNSQLGTTNTKAILVSKWVPRIFDPLILHKKMHPHIGITM